MSKKPTAVDLFCGCGGLTLGLKKVGFHVKSILTKTFSDGRRRKKR
jgi:tRNA/tmRNA/rRNA uracil-C5-methylase (TrmA/RlmC/RlmD family)